MLSPDPHDTEHEMRRSYALSPEQLRGIRGEIAETLFAWGYGCVCDDVVLVASELLTNVCDYTSGCCDLVRRAHDGRIHLTVTDTEMTVPSRIKDPWQGGQGWGLAIVDALTDQRLTVITRRGKNVCCSIEAPGRPASTARIPAPQGPALR
ncbi:ATP-binding protein [Streptomyces sp. NBC_01497]|uniref:ATP-binding protein n=1 Tax=Streptomyces sp. NBC_01497 TaxID=2903885 RepID=UPI002E2FC15F|nr:ATP-binding protein [Streptomyces sp. NBC_01497]